MTESLVPTVHCNAEPPAVYAAMADAWRAQVGTEPQRASLLTLMAQWSLETGSGAQCLNYNIAGIKHVPGDGHDYAQYETREFIDGQWVTLKGAFFRAYPTLAAGVDDYLHVLRGTFGYAWSAVEAGDTADFAHKLKARGYYTAPEQQYAAGLAARYQQMAAACPDDSGLLSAAESDALADVIGRG